MFGGDNAMVKVSLMPARRRSGASITPGSRAHPRGARPPRATRRGVLAAASVALALAPAASAGAGQVPLSASPELWATVNVCDTTDHPDTVGIRGSMPGSGRAGEQMLMRFQLQFLRESDQTWHNIGPSGDTGFVAVGSAKYKERQTGRNFTVRPPSTGAFLLRGAVTFEWRKDGEVVRRARERTSAGHGATPGADPPGFSAARCSVS